MAKRLSKRARASIRQGRKTFAGAKGAKACKIAREGRAHGKKLTPKAQRFIGARCGEFKKRTGKK